ncbi:hypothetical protein THS27_10185 [Thalassospira sp. MCCC 1A01428]|nr:hypothetical protein THS27_10185 [Thalassospira sp. MCCC 1A01428]
MSVSPVVGVFSRFLGQTFATYTHNLTRMWAGTICEPQTEPGRGKQMCIWSAFMRVAVLSGVICQSRP